MTELERARAHLRLWQDLLYERRKLGWNTSPDEECVLAALSWLWEEQNRTDGDYVFPMQAGSPYLGCELA